MYSRHLIKICFLFCACCLLNNTSRAAGDSTIYVSSPYKTEYNPWFKLSTFNRGFKKDSLANILDVLETKKRAAWSRNDSLLFATTSLNTGNRELSKYYFDKLNVDLLTENDFWWDHKILLMLNGEFEEALDVIRDDQPGILEFSELYFLEKIFEAKIALKNDSKWYKHNSVTKWAVDSTHLKYDKRSKAYKTEILEPLSNLNQVLKRLIRHIHDSDPIIARTCFEMGLILETHVSWAQAYIAYSLGRNFNKRDKEILSHVKTVKSRLINRKYKIPIFRRYFPRIEKWRFDYEVLKENIILEKNDTLRKTKPELMLPQQSFDFIIPPTVITIGGILVMFLIVLFFVRTKRK